MNARSRRRSNRDPRPVVCMVRQAEVEAGVWREVDALVEAGFDVDVICLAGRRGERLAQRPHVRVRGVPLRRARGSAVRYLVDYGAFFVAAGALVTAGHLRRRYRLVQVTTMPDLLVFASLPARLTGARVLAFMKEPTPELGELLLGSPRLTRVLVAVEQAALRYADHALTVTEELRATYVARGADPDRIGVVLNAPDLRHLRAPTAWSAQGWSTTGTPDSTCATTTDAADAAAEGLRRPGEFRVLCHGTIEARYGHETIVRAAAIARTVVPGLRVRILGSGTFAPRVAELIDALGVDDVVDLVGYVPIAQVRDELEACDVGVVAQLASGYSHLVHTNKMFEYMGFGKPVVASRLRATYAAFPDAVAWFEPGDAEDLARVLVGLAHDPHRAAELARAGLAASTEHGWDVQRFAYLDGVMRALRAPRGPWWGRWWGRWRGRWAVRRGAGGPARPAQPAPTRRATSPTVATRIRRSAPSDQVSA